MPEIVRSNEVTNEMRQYLGEHSSDLLMLAFQSMDIINDVTFLPDVKNKMILSHFEIDNIVKPFKAEFEAKPDAFRFKPRELDVKLGKAELTVIPEDYRQTYLASMMPKKGVAREPGDIMPFEQYIWEGIFSKFGEELNDSTSYFGDYNPAGNAAVDVADGYGKIIDDLVDDDLIVPQTLGTINNTNALDKFKLLWRNVPNKYRTSRWKWQMYMSMSKYEAYEEYLESKNYNTGRGEDMLNPVYLRQSRGLCELKPVSWMGNSNRIILTPKLNMLMGADALTGDLAKANIIQQMWGFDIGVAAALGFQVRIPGLMYINEAN